MSLRPRSIRARLALSYAGLLAVLLLSLAVSAVLLMRREVTRHTDRFLTDASGAFIAELVTEMREFPTFEGALAAALEEFQIRDITFAVFEGTRPSRLLGATPRSRAGNERAGLSRPDPARLQAAVIAALADAPHSFTLPGNEGGHRVFVRPHSLDGRLLLISAAQSRYNEREALEEVTVGFSIAVPVLLGLAAMLGYVFAWRSLRPVAAMSRQAREISAFNLQDRLPVLNPHDELGQLADVINQLLERLEQSFGRQRKFMTDASHELRTPVAVVRNEAEIALNRERTPDEYRDALRVVRLESVRLTRIVSDLFLLARADAGQQPIRPEELYLDELTGEVVRSLQSLATARATSMSYRFDGEAQYHGDEGLLRQLLTNLLDNAIKHARKAVTVGLERTDHGYELTVSDDGPGIPAEAQPHIFERFYRVDGARSRTNGGSSSGAGLGLAIARWVAEAHGGRLELVSSDGTSTTFKLRLSFSAPD